MFGWFGKKSGGGGVLAQVEELLVAAIPARVQALGIREPVYCLRIWYHGSDIDGDRVPSLMLVTEAARRQFLADRGPQGRDAIWFADELTYPQWMHAAEIDDRNLARLCRKWYRQRLAKEFDDEEEELRPIREAVQRVAARLNELEWSAYTSATDDFVVFPADSSHTFCDDYGDMKASVPAAKIELLRSRGLLGEGFDREEEEEDEPEDEE